jgi:hypothetical protein
VRTLLAGIEPRRGQRLPLAERIADGIAALSGPSPAVTRRRAALVAAADRLTRLVDTTFLG